ncbi:MAG: putative DNA binding domain-containing protein [Leptospiraceae bacterium]|nr:putative DNA binding domain-containing protein [Leptospiraceae bacterium]
MTDQQLKELLNDLVKQPLESEWVEFKLNFHSETEIGETISALSNGACIHNQPFGYLVFGIEDKTHIIQGTTFKARSAKKGNEDLEHWLLTRLNPKIDFTVYEFDYDTNRHISIYIIPATKNQPVEFQHQAYIRIGSISRKLNDFPQKQAKIWKKDIVPFEKEIAKDNLSASDITKYLSTETYFDLMKLPYPSNQQGVIEKFLEEGLILKSNGYAITKLGALLFAKHLKDFESIERKSIRVIVYKGKNKVETEREKIYLKGYVMDFVDLVDWINSQLPSNEEKGSGLDKVIFYNELFQLPPINAVVTENRTSVSMYSYKILNNLDKKEKIRDAMDEKLIKEDDPENKSRKYASYIPYWA